MATTKKMSGKQAIEHVLTGKRKPMTAKEIAEAALPLTALTGKTPAATLGAALYTEAKKPDGLVTKTGKGEFKLNPNRKRPKAETPAEPETDETPAADADDAPQA